MCVLSSLLKLCHCFGFLIITAYLSVIFLGYWAMTISLLFHPPSSLSHDEFYLSLYSTVYFTCLWTLKASAVFFPWNMRINTASIKERNFRFNVIFRVPHFGRLPCGSHKLKVSHGKKLLVCIWTCNKSCTICI